MFARFAFARSVRDNPATKPALSVVCSQQVSAPVSAKEGCEYFASDPPDLVIDGGTTTGGLQSTIADTAAPELTIIREGACVIDIEGLRGTDG